LKLKKSYSSGSKAIFILIILAFAGCFSFLFLKDRICRFLAASPERFKKGVLVVEGWMGHDQFNLALEEFKKGNLFPVCPEVQGGLPVPRVVSEIQGGTGADVLEGKAKVVNMNGEDVTEHFLKGAQEVLRIAQAVGAKEALLTERSPSCGCGKIFDGSFKDRFIAGDGVTAALFKKKGIKVTCIKVKT